MKKIFTVIATLIFSLSYAQEENLVRNENKHEFRLDALEILAIPNLEINYEYILNKYSGAGIAASVSLDNDYKEYQAYSISPYYRQYFLNKKDFGARGMFVEGLLRFAGGEVETNNFNSPTPVNNTTNEGNWFDIGVGLVVGQKWVSDNGFVFEVSLGGGRYLLDESNNEGFFRGGVLIGYRFF